MPLTLEQIDSLEEKASNGALSAVRTLAAAARENAVNEPRFRVTTADGITEVLTARQYLNLTATDLVGAKIEMVAA